MKFERETSNGWNHRFLTAGRLFLGWATLVKGEPWEGPWIGAKFVKSDKGAFARVGVRGFACAIGLFPNYALRKSSPLTEVDENGRFR
jgi:hypothetical protein